MSSFARVASFAVVILALDVRAHDCALGEVEVNPDNGATYAGLTGTLVCRDENGEVKSEQGLVDGVFVGLDRRRDLWGNRVERHINAGGNSHGEYRSFWPDGTPKETATYDDGTVVGEARHFHRNGRLAGASFSADGKTLASVEFGADGKLARFQCGDRSYLAEDRALCGFDGNAVTTSLYRHGREVERVTFRAGKPVESQSLEAGVVTASRRAEPDGEVRRTAFPDGKPHTEQRVVGGYVVAERRWYMNGALRSETTREPKARDGREVTREYRDDGTVSAETQSIGGRIVSAATHDERGGLKEWREYAADGTLARRRRYAPDGAVQSDDRFHPDGSRRLQ